MDVWKAREFRIPVLGNILAHARVVKIVARIWILGHFLENIQRAGHVIPKNMMKSQSTVYVYYGIVLNITSL